jgi:hypothetical protein
MNNQGGRIPFSGTAFIWSTRCCKLGLDIVNGIYLQAISKTSIRFKIKADRGGQPQ